MKQLAQVKKNGNLVYAGCIAMIVLCWNLGEYVNSQLAKIQPRALQQFVSKPAAPQSITFTPYQSAAPNVPKEVEDPDAIDFDEVFRAKQEPKVDLVNEGVIQAPKEPRYSDLIRQKLRIDSLLDNGAVLNGRFTQTGQVAEQVGVAGTTGQVVVPTLVAVTRTSVTLSVGKETFDVHLPVAGGNL